MKKRLFAILLCLASLSAVAQDWKVLFSASGGFYEDTFALELFSTYPEGHIRYTTNGNQPTAQSALYTEPLVLNANLHSKSDIYTIVNTIPSQFYLPDSIKHCIVIRAAVFDDRDSCLSTVTTQSYFIRALGCDTHGLPVVSITADSLALFDYETGIFVPGAYYDTLNPNWTGNYFMFGKEWERPMNIEFYELNNTGINQQAGIRTHGGNGRRHQQKSLKFYAREEYGKKRFKHQFFETIPQNNFKHLVLKPFVASWDQSGVNNHICNQIASKLNLESLASRPVLLYLNGEYWGIYFIQERPDERYLEDHFGIDIDNVNIMGNWYPIIDHGTSDNFEALYQWMETADLTQPDEYAYISSQIDIDNFIDYHIFEMFVENLDWPANNMRCWQVGDGPWRWIFYDGDACLQQMTFNAFDNAIYVGDESWPSNTMSTLFFRKLFENQDFKARFENRFIKLLYTAFDFSVTGPIFEDIRMRIEPEIASQSNRFDFPQSIEAWESDMALVKYFLNARAFYILEPLQNFLVGLPAHQSKETLCFPNPFSDKLYLFWMSDDRAKEIAIYDMTGRKVFSHNLAIERGDRVTIHPDLPAGVYVLKMGDYTQRIVRY